MSDSFSQIDAFVLLGGTWQVLQHNRCHDVFWIWLSCHEWLWMSSFVWKSKGFFPLTSILLKFSAAQTCGILWCLGRNKTQSNSESGFSAFQMFHAASGCFMMFSSAATQGDCHWHALHFATVDSTCVGLLQVILRCPRTHKESQLKIGNDVQSRVNKHEKKHAGWRAFHC